MSKEQQSLFQTSFKGVTFNFLQRECKLDRKVGVFDFSNSSKRSYEDLGRYPKTLEYKITITDTTIEGYQAKKEQLENILYEAGAGVLIDPYYGRINVIVTKTSVMNDLTYYKTDYNVTFLEVVDENNLETAEQLTTQTIESLRQNILSVTSDGFEQIYKKSSDISSVTKSFEQIDALPAWFNSASKNSGASIGFDLQSSINSLVRDAGINITNPTMFSSSLYNIINNAFLNTMTLRVGLMFSRLLFGFDPVKPFSGTSESVISANKNIYAINNMLNIGFASSFFYFADQINYKNDIEIDEVLSQMNKIWDSISNQPYIDDLSLSYLVQLRSDVQNNLLNIRLNIATVITIETQLTSAALLAYKYYGDSTRESEILELNPQIEDPAFVVGTVRLLSE